MASATQHSTLSGTELNGAHELEAPTAVRVLDVEQPVSSLKLVGQDGVPYRAVMLLIRRDRHPLGVQVLALDESGGISASQVSTAIAPLLTIQREENSNSAPAKIPDQLISVVIPTCAGGSVLVRCVRSVLGCEYGNIEVIVVDNRPKEGTTETILTEHFADDPRVRYAQETRRGSSYTRNKGLELANGELVAFADDDTVVDRGWLRAIANAFASEVSCVTGLILPLAIDTPTQAIFEQFAGFGKGLQHRCFQLSDKLDDPLFPYAAGTFGSGANTAMRKSVAMRLGGFDPKLGAGTTACGGEELDLYIRLLLAGEKIVYSPAAVLFHEHPSDAKGLRRRVFNYGVGLTAMLTNQALKGPKLALLRATPAGIGHMLNSHSRKNAPRGADYPRTLTVLERLGMLVGPLAYAVSARRSRLTAREDTTSHDGSFRPSASRAIELDDGLVDLELGRHTHGSEYGSLIVLARLHGDPLTTVEVPVENGRITARALADSIWAAAQPEIERHVAAHSCVELVQLTPTTLISGLPASTRCPARVVDEVQPPFVSLIVPTTRRPERIKTCLESLGLLEYPNFEIVIVDNAPDDPQTRTAVEARSRTDRRVRYVAEPLPGSSVARNRGVREAKGDILAFTDDDVVVDKQWLASLVEPFLKDLQVGVVTGLVLPAQFATSEQRWFEELSGFGKGFEPRMFDRDEHRADERLLYPYWGGVFGSGNSMAFRRSLINRIGGFDPALGAGSRALAGADIESFSHAIIVGSRLAYEPRAVCWHDHRADAAAVDKQMFNYGVGLTAILTKWLLRDPGLARAMVSQSTQLLTSLAGARRSSLAVPPEFSRFGKQLHMNRRRNTLGLQVRGYCLGPALYLRSVVWAKRLRLRTVLTSTRPSDE